MQQILTIGAKHQLTIPRELLERLGLGKGSQLLVELKEDHVVLHPAVSVPRRALPAGLRRKFESRRGAKPTDVPVDEFLVELRQAAHSKNAIAAETAREANKSTKRASAGAD